MTDQLPEIKRVLEPCPACDLGGGDQAGCTCSEWVSSEQVHWLVAEVERLRIDLAGSVKSLQEVNLKLMQEVTRLRAAMPPHLGGRVYLRAEEVTAIRRAEDDKVVGYTWEMLAR